MIHLHSMTNNSIKAVHSVSDLCAKTRNLLEEKFTNIWVTGEVSSISTPVSGHWYLSLKDDKSQLRCVMFKNANMRCKKPQIGDEVLVSGRFSIYDARGDLQLILNHMEARGAGDLHQQFQELKERLLKEGLFATEHKKSIPQYSQRIALITSETGAAVEDITTMLRKRGYGGYIKLFASTVQGSEAPKQLISAIDAAEQQGNWDLMLISRGGGSYEDLFCFNDENLARRIFTAKTPIISAVGHEVDSTICDFVADLRCATPTAAAEQIVAPYVELKNRLHSIQSQLSTALAKQISQKQYRLNTLEAKLVKPQHRLNNYQQYLDKLSQNTSLLLDRKIQSATHRLALADQSLVAQSPVNKLNGVTERLKEVEHRLLKAGPEKLIEKKYRFIQLCKSLELVSPLATVSRGYSVLQESSGVIVRSSAQVSVGQKLNARLADGHLELEVKSNTPN